MAGGRIAGGRRYQAVRITRSRPSVPSTCLDLIYLTQPVRPPLRGTWTTALTPMRIRHFAATSHLPSLLSFPRFHHRQGNVQSSTHGQQTFNPPPLSLWSPPPAHNEPYILYPPKRQTDI